MVAVPVSRRAVLAAGLLVPLAGCTAPERPGPPAPVDPDVALKAAAVAREQGLLQLYDQALAPSLTVFGVTPQVLTAVRAEHATHLAALTGPPPTPARSPAGPTAVPTSSTAPAPVPATLPALPQLLAAEAAAAGAHGEAVTAASRQLAALLATLAAAEAAHAVALG